MPKTQRINSQRISELKRERGYYAAFGRTENVKAIDKQIAELRAAVKAAEAPAEPSPEPEPAPPAPEVETATKDVSDVESADSLPRARSVARKRAAKKAEPPKSVED